MALIQALQLTAGSLRERVKEAFHRTTERNSPPDGAQYELTDPEITAYFRSLAMDWPKADVIDDRTWSDLEMERVFMRLNKSTTPLGAINAGAECPGKEHHEQELHLLADRAGAGPEKLPADTRWDRSEERRVGKERRY